MVNLNINDRVFIGGIISGNHKSHDLVNNKTGSIKKITFHSNPNYSEYIADVLINGKIHEINLSYLFKIDDLDTYVYDSLFDESPLQFYYNHYNLIDQPIMIFDELGLNYACCRTKDDKLNIFTVTSLN